MSQIDQSARKSQRRNSEEPTIAILVLGCLLPVYTRCIQAIRGTWGTNVKDTVDIYYVYGGSGSNEAPESLRIEDLIGQTRPQLRDCESSVHGDIILCGAADVFADQIDCILRKRLIAFEYLANRKPYDYIYTVCASSYVDVDLLQQYVTSLPSSGVYHGPVSVSKAGYPFVSGASILLSRDVAAYLSNCAEEIISQNKSAEPDDVAIGRWMAENYCDESSSEICRRIAAGEKATNDQTFMPPYGSGSTDYVLSPANNHVPHQQTFHYHFHSRRMWQMEEFHRLYFASGAFYSLAPDVELQELGSGGESVIVNVESGKIFTINASATEILAHILSRQSLGDATAALLSKYDIDRTTVKQEMRELIDELLMNGLIVGTEAS